MLHLEMLELVQAAVAGHRVEDAFPVVRVGAFVFFPETDEYVLDEVVGHITVLQHPACICDKAG